MKLHKVELLLDDDDYRDLQAEFARRQRVRDPKGGVLLPDGDSNLQGAMVAEICRSLREYRDLWEEEHPKSEF